MGSGDLDSLLKKLNIVKNVRVRIESLGEQAPETIHLLSQHPPRESHGMKTPWAQVVVKAGTEQLQLLLMFGWGWGVFLFLNYF